MPTPDDTTPAAPSTASKVFATLRDRFGRKVKVDNQEAVDAVIKAGGRPTGDDWHATFNRAVNRRISGGNNATPDRRFRKASRSRPIMALPRHELSPEDTARKAARKAASAAARAGRSTRRQRLADLRLVQPGATKADLARVDADRKRTARR